MRRPSPPPVTWTQFLAARTAVAAISLTAVASAIFALVRFGPFGPVVALTEPGTSREVVAALRRDIEGTTRLGDGYLATVGDLFVFDLGQSVILSDGPARPLVAEAVLPTLVLVAGALCLVTVVALPVGVAAGYLDGRLGRAVDDLAVFGRSVPNFWLAVVAVALFWPGLGVAAPSESGVLALFVSSAAVASALVATRVRTTAGAVREARRDGHVDAARAKGLSSRTVLWRHVAPVALLAHLRGVGDDAAYLVGAVTVVELTTPHLPGVDASGLGYLFYQATVQGDLTLAGTLAFLFAAAVVAVRFCGDLALALVDPRVGPG
ncbi:ABC transporter permease subunit [Haloarchaeobius sp. HRN-SO-5]|uniref:ABC transporter permease subunit n=1 Tax=Haloarchaeobius sp. HRN-SO-5 TaxID=3446118 RepID=UPI003EBFE778